VIIITFYEANRVVTNIMLMGPKELCLSLTRMGPKELHEA